MKALLVVDVQNDFCPGGTLAVPNGDKIIPIINALMERFELVLASRDWHPEDTVHFEKWPVHCVAGTPGADYHPKLARDKVQQHLLKGTLDKDDGYSAFEATNLDLPAYLKERAVDEVYVVGLATDYCVMHTALDAAKEGFKTILLTDATRGVNIEADDSLRAVQKMQAAGVELRRSTEL